MKCESCDKENTFLYFIGKTNICNKCVAKYTVFKEVKDSDDTMLRKAMRAFDIKSFDQLKEITETQLEALKEGKIKSKRGESFKYKDNRESKVRVGKDDYMEDQEELDIN